MITMTAIIENTPHGSFGWYAYLWDVPDASTPSVRRSKHVGKLKGPRGGSLLACQRQIKKAAQRLGAQLKRIDKHVRLYKPGQLDGNIIEDVTIWEPK